LRTAEKDVYPAFFDVAIGGVVGAGEDYAAAARRELAEEIGVSGVPLEPLGELRFEDEQSCVHGAIFSCRWSGPLRLQREEIAAAEWVEIAEVLARTRRERFCPDGLVALARYLESERDKPSALEGVGRRAAVPRRRSGGATARRIRPGRRGARPLREPCGGCRHRSR
jgi:8-oxo-dGTP pyrophosphatase MutT (NUDIX family)